MGKAKTASKNNPNTREKAIEYFINGQKISPVKIVSGKSSFFGAEYEASGDLVVGPNNMPLPWDRAKQG